MTRTSEADVLDGVEVQRAEAADGPAVAEVFWVARRAAVPAMPPSIHSRDSVERFWGTSPTRMEVWVACAPRVVGFVALTDQWLHSIYVLPTHQRGGLGALLLDLVKVQRPGGFGLWVFTSNRSARAFYLRHGLVEVEHTDGSGNEERAPDTRMEWHPGDGSGADLAAIGSRDPHDDQEDARDAVPEEQDPARPGL